MLSQPGSQVAIMFAFLFGFATLNAEEIPAGIMPQRRQVVGTGVTTSNAPTTSDPPTTSDQPTTSDNNDTPTTSDDSGNTTPVTSSTIPITTSNADGTTTTANVNTNDLTSSDAAGGGGGGAVVKTTKGTSDDNSVVKVGSTTINPKTLSKATTVREPLVTKATRHSTFTSTWTSNGQVYSSVYTTKEVFASTTGYATATVNPSLAHEGGDGSNLSTNTKKIIGGVVGGIGGAILIGGLAFVAWRLWGKKKGEQQEQEDMYSNDSLTETKRYSNTTLLTEPYSNPNGAVNHASNF